MAQAKSLLIAAAVTAAAWSAGSIAQETGAGTSGLPEVVITAQKRIEDIERVPISVSVLSNASFDKLNIQNLADVTNYTPGVDYQVTGPKNLLAIRGIYSGGGAATTAVY